MTTTWEESDAGPPRRYYALTGDGRTALTRFVEDWRRFRDAVDGVLGLRPRRPPASPASPDDAVPPVQARPHPDPSPAVGADPERSQ